MSGLPKGFGVSTAAGASTKVPGEASKKATAKKDDGAPRTLKRSALHRQVLPASGDAPSKRHKAAEPSPSLVSSNLGSLAEPFIRDTELKSWASRSEVEIQRAMAKASAELYYHTMTRLDSLSEKEARLKALEEEKSVLHKEVTTLSEDNTRLKADLDAHIVASKQEEQSLKGLLSAKDASLADALADVQDLQGEIASLKADREKIQADAYTEGFRGHLKGFLAVDPGYDWTRFGEATARWMEEFKVMEASAISQRKAQIDAEKEKVSEQSEARPEPDAAP